MRSSAVADLRSIRVSEIYIFSIFFDRTIRKDFLDLKLPRRLDDVVAIPRLSIVTFMCRISQGFDIPDISKVIYNGCFSDYPQPRQQDSPPDTNIVLMYIHRKGISRKCYRTVLRYSSTTRYSRVMFAFRELFVAGIRGFPWIKNLKRTRL